MDELGPEQAEAILLAMGIANKSNTRYRQSLEQR